MPLSPKRRLLPVAAAMAAVILLLFAIDAAVLLSPRQLDGWARHLLSMVFRSPFELSEVRFSLSNGLVAHDLVVYGPGGERTISVDEITASIDWRRLEIGVVRLTRPVLDIRGDAEGRVSLVEVLNPAIFAGTTGKPPALALEVEGASVRVSDPGALAPGQVIAFSDIDAHAVVGRYDATLRVSVRDPLWKDLALGAEASLETGAVHALLEIKKVHLDYADPTHKPRIPPKFWKIWELLRLHGTGDLTARFALEPGKDFEARGEIKVLTGGLLCRKFPYPGEDATGAIRIERRGPAVHLVLDDLHGAREGGTYRCDGEILAMPVGVDDEIDLRFEGEDMPVDEALMNALPPSPAAVLRRFAPTGRGSAQVHVQGRSKPEGVPDDIHVSVDAVAKDVVARFDGFPVPAQVSGSIHVRDERVAIEELKGSVASGAVTVRGFADPEARDMDVRVTVSGAHLDERLRDALLPRHREIIDVFEPRGVVDAVIQVRPAPVTAVSASAVTLTPALEPTFMARVTGRPGLTARFVDFPYPLVFRSGEVILTALGARIPGIEASAERGPLALTLTGVVRADEPPDGPPGGLELHVEARHLPIDEVLHAATAVRAEGVWRRLAPSSGEISALTATARVARKGAPVELFADADIAGAALRPEGAGLPISGLLGHVRLDPHALELVDVRASLLGAPVHAEGVVPLDGSARPTLRAHVSGLEIGSALRAELPERLRRAWDEVRPQGILTADVTTSGTGADLRSEVRATVERGAFLLKAFPLAATELAGSITAAGGVLRVDRLSGKIGQGRLELTGLARGTTRTSSIPESSFHISVAGLPCDARLLDAFPESRRKALAELALGGALALELEGSFDPLVRGGLLSYVGELGVANGKATLGLELSDLDAKVMAHGSWAPAAETASAISAGFAVRHAIWKKQPLDGFTGRIAADAHLVEVTELRGGMLAGIVTGHFYAFLDGPRLFGAELTLSGGRLERWAKARYSNEKKASGRLEAALVIAGESATPGHPGFLRGDGDLAVREGNIRDLPVFTGILNALSLELPAKPVFDNAAVKFRLEDNRIVIDRAEISSAALSFYGKGTIVEDVLDLRLTHELGRNWFSRIPFFGDLWRWLKGNIVELEVKGPTDDTTINVIPGKFITDPARRLFERGTGGEPKPPPPKAVSPGPGK